MECVWRSGLNLALCIYTDTNWKNCTYLLQIFSRVHRIPICVVNNKYYFCFQLRETNIITRKFNNVSDHKTTARVETLKNQVLKLPPFVTVFLLSQWTYINILLLYFDCVHILNAIKNYTLLHFIFFTYFRNNSVRTFGTKLFGRHWYNFCCYWIFRKTCFL
mgnify:CR=1 FL=1